MTDPVEKFTLFKINSSLLDSDDVIEIYLDDLRSKMYAWFCCGDLLLDPDLEMPATLRQKAEDCAVDHGTTLFRHAKNVTTTNGKLRMCVGPLPFIKRKPVKVSFLIGNNLHGTYESEAPLFTVQTTSHTKASRPKPRTHA